MLCYFYYFYTPFQIINVFISNLVRLIQCCCQKLIDPYPLDFEVITWSPLGKINYF